MYKLVGRDLAEFLVVFLFGLVSTFLLIPYIKISLTS